MKLFKDKKYIPVSTPRNFVAKYSKTSGAGPHSGKRFTRTEKHRDKTNDAL